MPDRFAVFEKTLQEYLRRIQDLDLAALSEKIGAPLRDQALTLSYFGAPYSVSGAGLTGPEGEIPPFPVSVVLCRYLLSFPDQAPAREGWVSFRDFPDAAPLAGWFRQNVERSIPRDFLGNAPGLAQGCRALGGRPSCDDYPYDVALEIPALPHLPVLVLFNDVDGAFPAKGLVLFDNSAQKLLDMECLSIVGWTLIVLAARAAGVSRPSATKG